MDYSSLVHCPFAGEKEIINAQAKYKYLDSSCIINYNGNIAVYECVVIAVRFAVFTSFRLMLLLFQFFYTALQFLIVK